MSTATDRIEKQIELKASLPRVWRALTDHREFGTWFRVDLAEPFAEGRTVRGRLLYPGYEHLTFEVIIEEMRAEQLFSFRWHPYAIDPAVDYSKEPHTLVEFRLEKAAAGTLLTVTESGFDKIPAGRRHEAFRMNEGGWTQQLKNIEEHVGSAP